MEKDIKYGMVVTEAVEILTNKFGENVWSAVNYVEAIAALEYPKAIKRPLLPHGHTAKEAIVYADLLTQYEKDSLEYKEKINVYREQRYYFDKVLEEFVKESAGIEYVPEQYRTKLYEYATSHSDSGYGAIFNTLSELVDIFTEPTI